MKAKALRVLLVAALVSSLVAAMVPVAVVMAQATLYVDDDGCPRVGDGSPGNPYCTIAEAVAAASPAGGDTIIVAAGTYLEDDIDITKSLTVQGAGPGATIVDAEYNDTVFDIAGPCTVNMSGLTIINGDGNDGGGIYSDGATVTVADCDIRDNEAFDGSGGGIYFQNGNLTVTGCTVRDNGALDGSGGGIYFDNGTLTLINCTVSGNTATTDGGGIYNGDGNTVTMTNCVVIGNAAATSGGTARRYAGGIYNGDGSRLTMTDCTVSDNTVTGGTTDSYGGGIANDYGNLTMMNCRLRGNNANSGGAGLASLQGPVTMTDCTISDNTTAFPGTANCWGGGIYFGASFGVGMTMTGCTVSGNTATGLGGGGGSGGGIYHVGGPATITNCTFSGNTATQGTTGGGGGGGAIVNEFGILMKLTNCTVIGNTADSQGGGIWNDRNLEMTCTIVYGNHRDGADDNVYNHSGGTDTRTQCIIGPPNPSPDPCPDPLLGPLQDNGGPTETHALRPGSPAIDACTDCTVATDQRGEPRPARVRCDIGAYELQASPPNVPDVSPWGTAGLALVLAGFLAWSARRRLPSSNGVR